MQYEIRRTSVDEFFGSPACEGMLAAYFEECGRNPALGEPHPKIAMYRELERQGVLIGLGVYAGDELVGYASVYVTPSPRYDSPVGVLEGVFVSSEHRRGGAGGPLLRACREAAKQAGAAGLYVTAPEGGKLQRLARALKWEKTNECYWLPS